MESVSHTKSGKSVKSSSSSTFRYSVQIGWSETDQTFVAAVPELSGCLADGSTYESAVHAIEEEIEIWLETARLEGWKIPAPKVFKSAEAVAEAG
jgi:predicted RNase H-like HicB family nuclease